jgi:hypothetical protein
MDKNHKIAMSILVIVVGVGAFFGGMKYDQRQKTTQFGFRGAGQESAARSGMMNNTRGGQRGTGGQGSGIQNGGVGDFAGGQVTAKDDTSVTIKTRNGGSQIVFFAPSTTIDKSVTGASSDLFVGQQVTVSGKNNPDGSLAATTIQIRPDIPANQ